MKPFKSLLLVVVLFLMSSNLFSQVCQPIWTNQSGSISGEKLFTDNSINATSITLLTPGATPASSNFLPGETVSVIFPSTGSHPFTYIVSNSSTNCSDTIVSSIQVCLITPPTVSISPNPGDFTVSDPTLTSPGENGSIQFNLANPVASTITGNTNLSNVNTSSTLTTDSNGPHAFWYHVNNGPGGCYDSILVSFSISTVTSCQAGINATHLYWISDGTYRILDQSSNFTTGTFTCPGASPSTLNFNGWSGWNNYIWDDIFFSANGSYPYTYVTHDSISNCSDTINGVINVTSYPPPCNLQAGSSVTHLNPNPQYYHFYDNSTNVTGTWSGSLSFTPDPGIGSYSSTISNLGSYAMVFNANGVYYYTYTVTDSLCSSTITDSVVVFSYPSGSPCQADIQWTMGPGPGEVTLLDTSTNFTSGTFYCADAIPQTSTVLPGVGTVINFASNHTFQYTYATENASTQCTDSIQGVISISGVPCPPMSPVQWTTTSTPGEIIFEDPTFNGVTYASIRFLGPLNTFVNPAYQIYQGTTTTVNLNGNGTYVYKYRITNNQIVCADSIIDSLVINSFTGCQAGLTSSENSPGNIYFTDQSTNVNQGELYCAGANPQTTTFAINSVGWPYSGNISFSSNGSYPYTYVTENVSTGCIDTITGVFIISGLPTPCTVQADLTLTPGAGLGEYMITDNSTGGASVSYFDPGNGQGATQLLPSTSITVNYPSNGVYLYEYIVLDSTGNCSDTLSGAIVVSGYPLPCTIQASLNVTQGAVSGEFTISDNSTNAASGMFYSTNASGTINLSQGGSAAITYASNGWHSYTYIAVDSTGNCSDTLTDSLYVIGVSCGSFAGLIITPGANPGEYVLTDDSSFGDISYFFHGSGGAVQLLPTNSSITYTYPANGTYDYKYLVIDSQTLCKDSVEGTLVVTGVVPPSNCSASFTLLQDSLNVNQYYCWNNAVNSTGGTSGLTYLWDFGDGATSTLAYPTHTYSSLGNFTLCLTITEAINGCTSAYCDTVVVTVKATGTTINILPPGATIGLTEENIFTGLVVFPNPSHGEFAIQIEATKNSLIGLELINGAGQGVFSSQEELKAGENELQIHQSQLSKGLYLLKIRDRETGSTKVVRCVIE
ncbi:MAG: PKD domain-containing protein [Crocinitomicaceae bacterium]